jgi:peptidoglycan/LPS O-acetylase OafA/YrhL
VGRVAGFDGLRALSVIAVVLTHLGVYEQLKKLGWLGSRTVPLVDGWTGVQVFFVLSGFLITALLIHERAKTGTVSLRNFYLRRVLRILPLYFLVLLLTLLVHLLVWPVITGRGLLAASVFGTNFMPKPWWSSLLAHTWSLAVEEHFYLIWPFSLALLLAFDWRKAVRYLLLFTVLSVGVCALVIHFEALGRDFYVETWSFFAGVHIALGCAAAILVLAEPFRERAKLLLASPVVPVLAVAAFSHSLLTNGGFFPRVWTSPFSDLVRSLGIVLLVSWIFVNQGSIVVRLLEVAPLRYIGKISYGVYMWQGFLLSSNTHRFADQLWPPSALVGLACLVVVAPLSFHVFEQPITAIGKRFRASYGPPPEAVPAE